MATTLTSNTFETTYKDDFVDSDNLNIMDNSLINIAIQKSSSGHEIDVVHTYDLLVGKSTGGKIWVNEIYGGQGGYVPIQGTRNDILVGQ